MSQTFLPTSDSDRLVWMNNFNSVLPQFATALGLTSDDLQTVSDDTAYFGYIIQYQNDLKQHQQAITQYKKRLRTDSAQANLGPMPVFIPPTPPLEVPGGIFNRLNTLVYNIKHSTGYTAAIGQALNIIPPATVFNPNTTAPEFTVRLDGGHPYLKWKKGIFDAMAIYSDRGDGNGFVFVGHRMKPDFLDVTALPANSYSATWSYKIRGMLGDDEVGLFSEVISINVIKV